MNALLLLSVLSLLLTWTNAQSYIPRPVVKTSSICPTGSSFVTYGNNDVQATDIHLPTTSTLAGYIATNIFNVTQGTTTIHQLSFGISDNLQITSVTHVRLGLYQVVGTSMTKVGMTEEIMLYQTSALVLYADLIAPVTIQKGLYAVAVWSSAVIMTGINDVVTGQTASGASLAYTSNGLPNTFTATAIQGTRALQMIGCSTGEDPWSGPTISYYSFCLAMQYHQGAISTTTAASTVNLTFSGVIAVNTATGLTNEQGRWYTATAGNARLTTVTYGGSNSAFTTVNGPVRTLMLGGGFASTPNQRFYPNNPIGVDAGGMSFRGVSGFDSTQYVIQYQLGVWEVMTVSPGFSSTFQAINAVFTSQQVSSPDSTFLTCATYNPSYVPQAFTCPSGFTPVRYGDDTEVDADVTTNSATSMVLANYLWMRPFTANIPDSTIYQLTWLINGGNPSTRMQRIRLGLFTNRGTLHTLVQQTQEIKFWGNTQRTLLRANLIQPIALTRDLNYSIGVVSDTPIYTSYAAYQTVRSITTSTYQSLAPSTTGFPSTIRTSSTTSTVLPVAAAGCTPQLTQQKSFCAVYVYPSYNQVYSGVLTTTLNSYTDPATGVYHPVIEATGTTFSSATPTRIIPFTLHDYNLDGNNRLYVSGNSGRAVDGFGLQFVHQVGIAAGLASQHRAAFDVNSDSYMYKESTQSYASAVVSFLNPIISDFTFAAYTEGQPLPTCTIPPRPINSVSPLSVVRVTCPGYSNDMADTFGDINVANFAQYADGTLIQGNRVYTQQFTADSAAVVHQLALGILQNADRPAAIQVRLGLYSQSNNSLIAQTNVLTINQAVPQLINMDLPFAISLQQGQTYLIAVQTSAPLEVAHTGVATSPSMAVAFSATGLPATFTSSGNDVSPSIAAYACVRATHSFCANMQYVTPDRQSYTYLYQGLIQAGPTSATNGYGVYRPIWAASGRLVTYRRTAAVVTQTNQVFNFFQTAGNVANLYISSANGKALDAAGIQLQTNIGVDSHLQFNTSIDRYDDSFSFASTLVESDLLYSNFSYLPIDSNLGVPACGLESMPITPSPNVPLPSCDGDNEVVTYGDGNQFALTASGEGVNSAPAPQIFLRQFTSDGARWTAVTQLKFGINTNLNTYNKYRLGIYNNRMQYIGGTEDIEVHNTYQYMVTGVLQQPIYLAPATVYHLAVWIMMPVYAGFSASGTGPSMIVPFEEGVYVWPDFVNTNPNSQRAIGAFGCTLTEDPTTPVLSSSSSTSNPFISSSQFSSSQFSSSQFSSSAQPSSSTSSPAVSSSTRPSSSSGVSSSASTSVVSSSSATFVPADTSSTTKSGLESGAIAGVVIGCVIGSNLILLFCVWCCCLGGAVAGKNTQHKQLEESRVGGETYADQDEIEMESAA